MIFFVSINGMLGLLFGILFQNVLLGHSKDPGARRFLSHYGAMLFMVIFTIIFMATSYLALWNGITNDLQQTSLSNNQTLYDFVLSQTGNQPITKALGIAQNIPGMESLAQESLAIMNKVGINESEVFQAVESIKQQYSMGDSWLITNSITSWMDGILEMTSQMGIY